MAKKEPMRMTQAAKENIGYGAAGLAIPMMAMIGPTPVQGLIAGGIAAGVGAVGGVVKTAVDAHKARKSEARAELVRSIKQHPALGRQFD